MRPLTKSQKSNFFYLNLPILRVTIVASQIRFHKHWWRSGHFWHSNISICLQVYGKNTYFHQPGCISESDVGTLLVKVRGSLKGVILPTSQQEHIWQSLEVFSVITAGVVLPACSGEGPGILFHILHTPTTGNYPIPNVNNVEAEILLQVWFIPQLTPRKGASGSFVILFGQTPWCSWLTEKGHDILCEMKCHESPFVCHLRCSLMGRMPHTHTKIILSSETN